MNKKVIIVSGSSGEIGSAIVKAFIQDNSFVIGLDKDSPKKTVTTDFKHISVDLYNFSEDSSYSANIIENIKKSMPSNYSRLIIINNAALQILKPINEISISDWNNSFYINTFSPFFLVQAFLNELSSSSGQVINITSIHSRLTKRNVACYSASKAALDSLTRSMAM
jgi:Dehydrogenases with different specificities (related to short-chain alcohol dehydrogenases)